MLENIVIITDLIRLGKDKEDSKENAEEPDKLDYTHSPQMFRHTIMLMLLLCSMFSGMCISITRIYKIVKTVGAIPGVYKVGCRTSGYI